MKHAHHTPGFGLHLIAVGIGADKVLDVSELTMA